MTTHRPADQRRRATPARALLVAGGTGSRMAASGAQVPKPLVEVGGRSLLEHNLMALRSAGLCEVTLAHSTAHPEIPEAADVAAASLALDLDYVAETAPLGSVGALAEMPREDRPTLIVNADNLTALDLSALLERHHSTAAVMTQAVHVEPFHMPFGEIVLTDDQWISAYREKPTYEVLVSSAVTVVSPAAISLLQRGEFANLPHLANLVLQRGLGLAAHVHCAPWIDVNDLDRRERAEELLRREAAAFASVGITRAT